MAIRLCWRLFIFCTLSTYSLVSSIRKRLNGGDPELKPPPWNCVGWPNSGSCRKCESKLEGMASQIVARCSACPDGWALLPGPPVKLEPEPNSSYPIHWYTHCAPLVGDERRLIMIRHGQSIWNKMMEDSYKAAGVVGAFVGTDSPLSSLGLRQAQRLAQILKKTNEEVYGKPTPSEAIQQYDDFSNLIAARSDLSNVVLEDVMPIIDKVSGTAISDKDMVKHLAREENREELDVLLGRKCDETNLVSSQLARAMDTLLIASVESRMACRLPWFISSNLQEIEHNSDCTPNAQPENHPAVVDSQRRSYIANGMRQTEEYIAARYKDSDVSRFLKNYGQVERARWYNQSSQMLDEVDWMFESDKIFTVWGGHSIWFRHFFKRFADLSNPVCKELTSIKMANTAMVSIRLRRVQSSVSPVGYAAMDCKFVHLGSSKKYKLKLNKASLDLDATMPEPADFEFGVSSIMGWKCCCSRENYKDAKHVWFKRKSLGVCVLARTEKCSYPKTWTSVWPKDMSFVDTANDYHWGSNAGPCDVDPASK